MSKIGMLLPEKGMEEKARTIVAESKADVVYLKAIATVDAVNEARLAVEAGAHIIIARGYQAQLIKQYTNIPLVEMRLQPQEIGLLIQQAKILVKKEHPVIAILAFENMLADLSYMEELFGVTLKIEYLDRIEDAMQCISDMREEMVDVIIGGEITCQAAERLGYPSLFYQSTEESLREALKTAENMAFALEIEKQNTAQFETVLDTSFNGIIKVNAEGKVIVINKMVENLLGRSKEEIIGLPLEQVFPQIETEIVDKILSGATESYSTSISVRNKAWMLLMAPIQYDDIITGAILALRKIADASVGVKNGRNEMRIHGFAAQTNFQDIHTVNQKMREVLEEAKIFALSESPILIYGQAGSEDYLIAEAIHNNSNRKAGPYVSINMRGMDKENQMEELFRRETADGQGIKGAMVKANHGTLFIKGAEHLTLRVQHQILRTMLSRAMMRTDAQPLDSIDVRIIASSKVNLKKLVDRGDFSEELYYMIQGLTLDIPSLNQRPEDLRYHFDREVKRYSELYNRHLTITDGGYQKLQDLAWNGNVIQLKSFCERLVLSAKKRSVDEVMIQKLFDTLYPHIGKVKGEEKVIIYKSPEGEELSTLLEKYHGNRSLVAKELGISTTTLWRKMKKYGIEAKFDS
ncbi:MAG: PrpR N-terminal domain-containing protein [Oliverpabstia sp.]